LGGRRPVRRRPGPRARQAEGGRRGGLLHPRPAEVAALVAFVYSPLVSATNGAAVRVDGGVVRSVV
ncbi:MAG TPA: hypothetical protein VFE78_21925, partial [Gemmataceae bacterium]|nr:hypothetical protein [Gemmataceae bacterium]